MVSVRRLKRFKCVSKKINMRQFTKTFKNCIMVLVRVTDIQNIRKVQNRLQTISKPLIFLPI